MEGCGPAFAPCVTPELRALLFRTLLHPNRFARETGYHVLAAVCQLAAGGSLLGWAPAAVERLQDGLSENWSQVCAGFSVLSAMQSCCSPVLHSTGPTCLQKSGPPC